MKIFMPKKEITLLKESIKKLTLSLDEHKEKTKCIFPSLWEQDKIIRVLLDILEEKAIIVSKDEILLRINKLLEAHAPSNSPAEEETDLDKKRAFLQRMTNEKTEEITPLGDNQP